MPQTPQGQLKASATRIGVPVDEYLERRQQGQKWCSRGKHWISTSLFQKDLSRSDGLQASCFRCAYRRRSENPNGPGRRTRSTMKHRGFFWCYVCKAWLRLVLKAATGSICRPHRNELDRIAFANGGAAKRARIHARKRGIKPIPLHLQFSLLALFNGICAYCAACPSTSWDHIVAVVHGGQSVEGNVVPACMVCNSSKGSKEVKSWMKTKGLTGHPSLTNILAALT